MSQQFNAEENSRVIQQITDHYDEYIQADIDSDEENFAKIAVEELAEQYESTFERQHNLIKAFVRIIPDFPVCAQVELIRLADINNISVKTPYIYTYQESEPIIIDTSEHDEIECYYNGLALGTLRDVMDPDFVAYRGINMKGFFYIPSEYDDNGEVTDFNIIGGLAPLGLSDVKRSSYQLN